MPSKLVILAVVALGAPAAADDLSGQALEGPFTTRADACAAVLAVYGTCTSYRVQLTAAATPGWGKVEIGAVADARSHSSSTSKHFALVVEIDHRWFGRYLGTEGTIDTEFFPPCKQGGGVGSCTPFHADKPSHYAVPKLSWVNVIKGGAKELVMFYPTPADTGFRTFAPAGELVQVCGVGAAHVPSCTYELIAVTRTRAVMTSPAALFAVDGAIMTVDDTGTASETHLVF